jgi:aspartyl-tRNA(Asn)/glutamyl-tRNA(Gln) amidotransferase subunit C
MPITREQVEYVALLARLELSEDEKQKFARQLDAILQAVGKLNELDTEHVEPLVHIAPRKNVFREDTIAASLPREEVLRNAPDAHAGCFRVPRIIE